VPELHLRDPNSSTDIDRCQPYAWQHINSLTTEMEAQEQKIAVAECTAVLQRMRAYNVDHRIAPSEVRIIDKLLHRGLEMSDVYADVHRRLRGRSQALQLFFQAALDAGTVWNPKALQKAIEERKQLLELNEQVAVAARTLGDLLAERTRLQNSSSYGSDTHHHVGEVIEAAAVHNHLFNSYVKEGLNSLYRYDSKYWPSLSDFMEALAHDADEAEVQAYDEATEVGTSGQRGGSLTHFIHSMFQIFRQFTGERSDHLLPDGFDLRNESWAALVNCLLDLGPDDVVTAESIKSARRKDRDARAG